MGVSTLKAKNIKGILFEELIPNFNELLEDRTNLPTINTKVNP
jgi:hypothetical protein